MSQIEADHREGGSMTSWTGVVVDWGSGAADGRQRRVEKGRHWNQRLTRAVS